MIILRLAPLPPDLEVELYRSTSGETVKWSGVSSGLIERVQGWTIVGAGLLVALAGLGDFLMALDLLGDMAADPAEAGIGDLIGVAILSGFFILGLAVAVWGWRFVAKADRVVWAVTNRRLIRLAADGVSQPESWTRRDIRDVRRMNWDEPQKRGLAVTVRGRGDSDLVLFILGPDDLERAEKALAELED